MSLVPYVLSCVLKMGKTSKMVNLLFNVVLNTERSYKRQGHAPLKHFVGSPVQWWKEPE